MSQHQKLARKLLDLLGISNSIDDLFEQMKYVSIERSNVELFEVVMKKEDCLQMLEGMLFDIYNKDEIAYSVAIYSTELGQRILKKEHIFMKKGREAVLQYIKNKVGLLAKKSNNSLN